MSSAATTNALMRTIAKNATVGILQNVKKKLVFIVLKDLNTHLNVKRIDMAKTVLKVRMTLISEANNHEYWRKKYVRNKKHKNSVRRVWLSKRPTIRLPCKVSLTRIGPRLLDSDNLAYAFKAVRDELGDLIIPGLAPGRADGEGMGIEWFYKQEKSTNNINWIIVEIEDAS